MTNKVVYNDCFGGFSISHACAKRMAELGNKEAQSMLEDTTDRFYGYLYDTTRHDSTLVQAVEELGETASGHAANLRIHELSGDKYYIDEYDGSETVVEPEDICWITV